jgi:hypothetical protein
MAACDEQQSILLYGLRTRARSRRVANEFGEIRVSEFEQLLRSKV